MKRAVALFLVLLALLMVAAFAQQPTPTEPVVNTLPDLLKGVHLYGCQIREHGSDPSSECLSLRRAILASAITGNRAQHRRDFQDAAKVCRESRNLKVCVEALERRAAD